MNEEQGEDQKPERRAPSEMTPHEFVSDPFSRASVALNNILRRDGANVLQRARILTDFQAVYDSLSEAEMFVYHAACVDATTAVVLEETPSPIVTPGGQPARRREVWKPGEMNQ